MSAVLRMKRSLELANDKKERLKNALARVKGNPDSEYAAHLVQSARRTASRQDSVVKRQIGRIHEIVEAAIDGDVTGLEEMIDEALCARIDEPTGKGKAYGIAHAYQNKSWNSSAMANPDHRWYDPENEKQHKHEENIYNLRSRRALSMAKAAQAKRDSSGYGAEDYARHKEHAQHWKKKQKAAGTIDREERMKAQRKAYVQSRKDK